MPSRVLGGLVCLRLPLAVTHVLLEVQDGPMTAGKFAPPNNEERKEEESIQYEHPNAVLGRSKLYIWILGCYATMLRRGGFLGPLLDPFNNACTEIVVNRSNAPNL